MSSEFFVTEPSNNGFGMVSVIFGSQSAIALHNFSATVFSNSLFFSAFSTY